MASEIKKSIISNCQSAKFYLIIIDCTTDITHQEQLTIVLRFYNCKSFAVEEHFIGFVDVKRTTGDVLTETFLKHLTEAGQDISNCRGQLYDNEANMKGIHSGVQKRIRDINPRAFFVSCSSHSLSLIVCDAAKFSSRAVSFNGLVQEIYNFFSGSNIRWAVSMKSVQTLTLMPLSDTR